LTSDRNDELNWKIIDKLLISVNKQKLTGGIDDLLIFWKIAAVIVVSNGEIYVNGYPIVS